MAATLVLIPACLCTQGDCENVIRIEVRNPGGPFPAGEYVFSVSSSWGTREAVCKVTAGRATCESNRTDLPSVLVIVAGDVAFVEVQEAFGAPPEVTVAVSRDGTLIVSEVLHPSYTSTMPTGDEICGSEICDEASVEMTLPRS